MADPAALTFRPLEGWPEKPTADRRSAPFRAHYERTLDRLAFEAGMIGAELVVIQLDLGESDLRVDGMPKMRARPIHPGVAVSFESDYGPLRYATDKFDHWQGNLRAVALGLVDLRRVERYGITKRGEQYRGWLQLPAPSQLQRREEAAALLAEHAGEPDAAGRILGHPEAAKHYWRAAARRAHPDNGGDQELLARLQAARDVLAGGGR